MTAILVQIDDELAERLRRLAAAEQRSETDLVREAVAAYVSNRGEGAGPEPAASITPDAAREKARAVALDQFLLLARTSSFRSAGPYATRDELHERH